MGRWTLGNFRTELSRITGGEIPTSDTTTLDLYINMGQDLLVGIVEFNVLKDTDDVSILAGTDTYALPANMLGIRQAILVNEKKRLIFTSPDRWTQFVKTSAVTNRSQPKRWTVNNDGWLIWPPPDKDYLGRRDFLRQPVQLTVAGNVTQFLPHWDLPILWLGGSVLLTNLDQESRGTGLYNKAISQIHGIMTDDEYMATGESDGLWVAHTAAELSALRGSGVP